MDLTSSTKQLSDEELASRATTGSQTSFEELVCRYSLRLYHFLRHKTETDQDIEDLVQETFLKAFRNIDRYDSKRKFSTWLYTIAVRQAISRYRLNRPKESFVPKNPSPDPQEALIQKEESQNLWYQARTLHPKEYEALWLRYAEDMSVKDIAKVLNKKPITVRVLLHRARLNLAQRIRPVAASENREGTASIEHKFSIL